MAVDFTGKIYTVAELREQCGDPSLDPTAINYMPDSQFQNIINRYTAIAESQVDEAVNTIDEKALSRYARQAEQVDVDLAPSLFSNDLAFGAIDTNTYIPFAFRAVEGDVEFVRDEAIETTSDLATVLAVNRYRIVNDEIYVTPVGTAEIHLWLVPKSVVENRLSNDVALEINELMMNEALVALKNRITAATLFKEENKSEAP